MSLLDFLRPQQAQVPGATQSPFQNLLAPEVALPMAAMLLGNQGNSQNLGNAFMMGGQALGQQKELQAQTARENQTWDFLAREAPEIGALRDSGMSGEDALRLYAGQRYAKPTRNEYEERRAAAQQYGLEGDDATSFVLTGQLPTGRFGSAEVGLNPIPVLDDENNVRLYQPTKSGPPREMLFPEGYRPMSPFETSFQKAKGGASGKMEGEAGFDLPRVEQNAAHTLNILERMKTHPGRASATGFAQGALPAWSPSIVDFRSLVDQTQGQSFLQAFQMLKGGGQITEIEGQKATAAISRLGNQRLSDEDYKQAIQDLEDVIMAGLARARRQAGMGQEMPAQPGGSVDYKSKYGLD